MIIWGEATKKEPTTKMNFKSRGKKYTRRAGDVQDKGVSKRYRERLQRQKLVFCFMSINIRHKKIFSFISENMSIISTKIQFINH